MRRQGSSSGKRVLRQSGLAQSVGTTVTYFQVQDNGTTGQATTATPTDLAGLWGKPILTIADFRWKGLTGVLTVGKVGVLDINASVVSHNEANNRHELHVDVLHNDEVVVGAANYASRSDLQDEGQVVIPGFLLKVDAGDKVKLQVWHVGVAATIGAPAVANQTYLSARLLRTKRPIRTTAALEL